jgi:cell division protein ZapA
MKQLEVTILGQSYILGCPEGGERELLAAVAMVDHEMSAIRDAGKVKARERMAVLAALNLAYQLAEGPAPAAASAAGPAPALDSDGNVNIAALIARIDAVLEDDGHLL